MANPAEELDNLSGKSLPSGPDCMLIFAVHFEWRHTEVWRVYYEGDHEEAEGMAEKLLMEPQLNDLHRASMHVLLANSPKSYVEHAKEAVRLYTQILQDPEINLSPEQQTNIHTLLEEAKLALRHARSDKSAIDREVDKLLSVFPLAH